MNLKLGLIMFVCLVPFLIAMYFIMYPKKWHKRKNILGIRNREEYKIGETEKKVDEIVQDNREIALRIVIIGSVIAALLLLIPNLTAMMITYTIYILLALVVAVLPYVKGNTELKALKRELGIEAKGVRVADLKSISASHALNMPMLLLPNIIAAVGTVFALLFDLKVISIPGSVTQGSYVATAMAVIFLSMGILFIFLAKLMDNMRNDVISEESEVNSNYNRAKKKMWSDAWIQFSWMNTGMLIFLVIGIIMNWSELAVIVLSVLYMLGVFVIIAIVAHKTALLNECYKYENDAADDDDNWIYGLFYYNPKDGRVNIERRDGMGVTINMAHPLGKIYTGIVILVLIGTVAALIWVGAMEATATDIRYEDGKVICHHLSDEYVIPEDEILEVSIGDNMEELRPIRVAGTATDHILKGRFSINGEEGKVRLFIKPEIDLYIRIKTADYTYFINDNTEEDTRAIYEEIK